MIQSSFRHRISTPVVAVFLLMAAVFISPVMSFAPPENTELVEALFIEDNSLGVLPSLDMYFFRRGERMSNSAMQLFHNRYGNQWDVFWDTRSNRPELISGQGIPFIPGPGNDLVDRCIYGNPADELSPYKMADAGLRFIEDNPELFRVDPSMLEMHPDATLGVGKNNRLWFINFRQVHENILVKDSGVFIRVNSGNITQLGSNSLVDIPSDFSVKPAVSSHEAMDISIDHALMMIDGDLEIVKPPELYIIPTFGEGRDGIRGELYTGTPGNGYEPRLVWELIFRLEPHIETWYSMVDAQTGDILKFQDDNKYAAVYGGSYLEDNLTPEQSLPFAFAETNQGTATSGGRLDYPGGNVTCTLNGQYVRISDNCGNISLTRPDGDLNFGMSSASNCSTPGFGGAGNTRASRTAFYHVNDTVMKARAYLPNNSWLQGKLLTNVNINSTCNAFWNGTSINFYRQGSGCSNTAELSPVVYHEWGHGIDSFTSFSSPDHSSSEALADAASVLHLRTPCIGHNFFQGGGGSCTGVRDVSVRPHARPDNIHMAPLSCNCTSQYSGVLGYQGHCESHIASGAVYDMALKLADAHGGDAGWAHANRLFFENLNETRAAYQLVSGGQCNPNAVVNGCASRNWYTVWLFADDDNGNLADGTPNGCLIWDAFADHGIACGDRPPCYTVCPPLFTPNLIAVPGQDSTTLSWQPVQNAAYYLIFRNSSGCQYERSIIGTTTSTQYMDDTVANDFAYYYSIQAVGANDACKSQMSACLEVIPGSLSPYDIITMDRTHYTNDDEIIIQVLDADLLGTGTVDVTVESDTNPSGITVTLTEIAPPSGIMEGAVMTTTSSGVPGKITISHGDQIRAIYFDEDIGDGTSEEKTASAQVDLIPPVITNISVDNIGSRSFTVSWETDKPANSVLVWGNMIPPFNMVEKPGMVTSHSITLSDLAPSTEYYFLVRSTDIAGNTTENDNNGMYHRVTTLQLLWDQPVSSSNPSRRANQVFPSSQYGGYSCYLADDFVNTETWLIKEIFVPGELYNGGTSLANATTLHWRIYADNGGLPAGYPGGGSAPFWSLDLPTDDLQITLMNGLQDNLSDTSITLENPIQLPAGTWWLMFYPTMNFSPHGQFGRISSDTTNLSIGKFINPGGDFGHGTNWINWNNVSEVTHDDLAFRISGSIPGQATPTPTQPPATPTPQPGTPTPTPDPNCLNHGDVNFDGEITAADAQLAFAIALGVINPTWEEECAADCNGDGMVTAADAQEIFFATLGIGECADPVTVFHQIESAYEEPVGMIKSVHTQDYEQSGWLALESNPDDAFQVDIQAAVNKPVDVFTVYLTYDPDQYQFIDGVIGTLDPGWEMFGIHEPKPGLIIVAAFTIDSLIEPGDAGSLAQLYFQPIDPGAEPLTDNFVTFARLFDDLTDMTLK